MASNGQEGAQGSGGIRVTGKAPSSLGERRMAGSAPCSEESAKQPEGYQVIGKAPSPQKDPAARRPSVA